MTGHLRVAARLVLTFAFLLTCVVLYFVAAPFSRRNPVPRLFLSGMLRIVGGRLVVVGTRLAGHGFLLANHVSWIDIFALAKTTGTAFVAHDGLAQFPPLRWLCRLNRTVFVARHDRAGVADQIAQVRDAIAESGVLTIFPEGTTSDGTGLLPFKSALLAAVVEAGDAVPVRPVWLDYGSDTPSIGWVGNEPGLDNAMRVLRLKRFTVTVHMLPPLTDADLRDRKTIAAAARSAIEAASIG